MDESTLNDLLECSVCLERLDTSSKVLPCQHTFCRKCLEVIVASRQELRCPECRILVSVKIDDLPPNVLLMRILEGLKSSAAATNKTQDEQENNKQRTDEYEKWQQLPHTKQQQQQKSILQTVHQQKQAAEQKPQTSMQTQQQQPHSDLATATQRRCLLPHAFALYDFNSTEPSDLHFKKGDLILLKQKIDVNWYVGHLNGNEGTFPSNYVQVIVPLPSPQCIALYDFKMGENEEEGCLNFKKGAIIHVLRRVDDNWAEGRIGNMIGIFPIAFVDLNMLAKQLLGNFDRNCANNMDKNLTNTNTQTAAQSHKQTATQQQSRNLPPIPPSIDPTNTTSHSSSPLSNNTSPSASSESAASNNRITTTTISFTTTNSSSSNTSINSSSLPNSPQQSLPSTPQHYAHGSGSVRYRDGREKRHSLNALLTSSGNSSPALSILQTNRHSAEILSIPSEELVVSNNSNILSSTVESHELLNTGTSSFSGGVSQPSSSSRDQLQNNALYSSKIVSTRANVLKSSCGNTNIPLPWGYLALYPYKPRKSDELELKKGCVYIVTERCLDGWFKGKNWQDISGVFPGNYVTPLRARDQQQLMHQWKFIPQPHSSQLATSPPSAVTSPTAIQSQQNSNIRNTSVIPPKHHTPPELPPRQEQATTATCPTVWTKPLSQTVEAFFNRNTIEKSKEKDVVKSKDSTSTSAAMSLMKRLAHIKTRAKSPSQTSQKISQQHAHNSTSNNFMDNTKSEAAEGETTTQANSTQLAITQPVHVRSGSCPSQLLQNFSNELTNAQSNNERIQNTPQQSVQSSQSYSTILYHGSERIKGHKERPRIQVTRQSMDGTLRSGSIYSNDTANTAPLPPYNIPNNLLVNAKCAQQQHQMQQHQMGNISLNNTTQDIYGTHHRKSHSLDANNTLIVGAKNAQGLIPPLPPSMPAPLSMQSSNIAAAIAASATTKSVHSSGRESRFRCIVPYPPNSDVELELHVGDIIYVQRKQKNGWYKGTHARTQKTGLFPASFVEPDL